MVCKRIDGTKLCARSRTLHLASIHSSGSSSCGSTGICGTYDCQLLPTENNYNQIILILHVEKSRMTGNADRTQNGTLNFVRFHLNYTQIEKNRLHYCQTGDLEDV